MDPEKRCLNWLDELISIRDNHEELLSKINEILAVLVLEDNDEIATRTMRTIMSSRELDQKYLHNDEVRQLSNFPDYYRRYATYILESDRKGNLVPYVVEIKHQKT